MNNLPEKVLGLVAALLVVGAGQGQQAQAATIADSRTEFSGVQGQDGWYYGYRNVTLDGKGTDYDAAADFIPFAGGDGQGDWDGFTQQWTGSAWDLQTAAAAPWTYMAAESLHPNGLNNGEEHWAIRRWVATELPGNTWLGVQWNAREENLAGTGVTGGLHVNGVRVQTALIAGGDGVGVTSTYWVLAKPTDVFDLILSPVGPTGDTSDGSDGSFTWMVVMTSIDSDSDGLPDAWEEIYFPGDLTKLSATGDLDSDGLKDGAEMQRGTDPTKPDTDADGLADGVETNTGTYVNPADTGTNPLKADTDNDGRLDGAEVTGTPTSDPLNPDTDGDGYSDGSEVASGHDPNDPSHNPDTTAIANSRVDFTTTGSQGEGNWYYGYRNFTADGGGVNYDADTAFIPFDPATQWTGVMWDLDPVPENPWTELGQQNTHPNGPSPVHWTIRRWVAAPEEIAKVTPLALTWHVHKANTGGGNGVTGALHINGVRVDGVAIAGTDGVGVTRRFYANVAVGDKIDLILSPRGADGADADGYDGSVNWLMVDPVLPDKPIQPDGSIFIPVGAGDSDADGLPDVWEEQFFPNDLTKLSANGDFDQDGLTDLGEYQRDSDPTKPDTDGDGLTDLVETNTGKYVSATDTGSSPKKADTDLDGLADGVEVGRTPPTDPNKADTDGDGFTDAEEIAAGTDPTNPNDNVLTFVIANSRAEFSGVQGQNGWYNGYRIYNPQGGSVDYDATQDFILFPGGEGQGDWDGVNQTWVNGSWDLNTAAAAPWTWQDSIGVHPNGANSEATIGGTPDPTIEQWPIRRWVATELTGDTAVTIIWQVRKTNLNPDGVTGVLFINGKLVDSLAIAGTDGIGQVRRYHTTLKKGDIVDLALSPEGLNGAREDWSDGSETWFWVDTRAVAASITLVGQSVAGSQCTIRWTSQPGVQYTVWTSTDLKQWTSVQTVNSAGTETTFTDNLGTPPASARFYRVSQ